MSKRAANATVVHTQMPSMGPKSPGLTSAAGRYNSSPAPFDKPQGMGNGGVPVKMFDQAVKSSVGRSTVSGSGVPASNLGGPSSSAQPRGRNEKANPPSNRK